MIQSVKKGHCVETYSTVQVSLHFDGTLHVSPYIRRGGHSGKPDRFRLPEDWP